MSSLSLQLPLPQLLIPLEPCHFGHAHLIPITLSHAFLPILWILPAAPLLLSLSPSYLQYNPLNHTLERSCPNYMVRWSRIPYLKSQGPLSIKFLIITTNALPSIPLALDPSSLPYSFPGAANTGLSESRLSLGTPQSTLASKHVTPFSK